MNAHQIHITTGTIWRLIFSLLFVVALYYLRDLVVLILLSVVIASAAEPLSRLLGKVRIPRVPAVLIVYIVAIIAFVSLFPLFLFQVFEDLVRVSVTLPTKLAALPFFTSAKEYLSIILGNITPQQMIATIQQSLFAFLGSLFHSTGIIATIFGSVARLVLVVVVSFYLAVQKDGVENFIRLAAPVRYEKYILDLWRRSQRKIGLWMQGQLLLGAIVGVVVYIGLRLLGIEYALMLAILAAVFELIPVIGPILSAVPAILLAFITGPTIGLLTLVFYVAVQQLENHLLYPLVVRKIVGVPSLVVILSLLVGGKLAGFVGLLLAVPAATVLMELVNDIETRRKNLTDAAA